MKEQRAMIDGIENILEAIECVSEDAPDDKITEKLPVLEDASTFYHRTYDVYIRVGAINVDIQSFDSLHEAEKYAVSVMGNELKIFNMLFDINRAIIKQDIDTVIKEYRLWEGILYNWSSDDVINASFRCTAEYYATLAQAIHSYQGKNVVSMWDGDYYSIQADFCKHDIFACFVEYTSQKGLIIR